MTSFDVRKDKKTNEIITIQEVAKKRSRKTVKQQRAIVGASLDVIKERRSQRPEARSAARESAIKAAKEKRAAEQAAKKAIKAKTNVSTQSKVSKQGSKGKAPKPMNTSR